MKRLTTTLILATGAAGLAATCASLTPEQNLAWDRWRSCDHFATIHLVRIQATGEIVATGREYEAGLFDACVRQVALEQRAQGLAVGTSATTVNTVEGGPGRN